MSFHFAVDPVLDSGSGIDEEEFVANYEDLYVGDEFAGLGLNPYTPTEAKPGSSDKVMMLAARYRAGLPLWNDHDCYDHGPGGDDEDESLAAL